MTSEINRYSLQSSPGLGVTRFGGVRHQGTEHQQVTRVAGDRGEQSPNLFGDQPSALRAYGSRGQHLGTLFETVLTRGPLSRRDAARLTGLSAASVTKLVKPMISHGYLTENLREADGPGRPQIPLQVVSSRHHAIGIKLMDGEIVGVMADLQAEVKSSHRMKFTDTSPAGVVDAVQEMTQILLERSPAGRSQLLGVGVGLGGHVNAATGMVLAAPFLGWKDVPLREMLKRRLNVPVIVENDVNTLAVAEQWFGAGSAFPTFLLVTLGVGVGCALVLNGRLWHGVSGAAGEFGHMIVDDRGPLCHCGKHGCLEAVVGDAAIAASMSAVAGRRITTVSQVVAEAHAGDFDARKVFVTAGIALGRAIATLLNLLNPPLVILSGEGMTASDLFIDALRAEMNRDAFSTAADDCTVLVRPLPDEAWARGAAATMLRHGVLHSLSQLSDQVPV